MCIVNPLKRDNSKPFHSTDLQKDSVLGIQFINQAILIVNFDLQVAVMQEELTALQPELIQTSAETDKLMEKIEQDSVEVEAQKEVKICL